MAAILGNEPRKDDSQDFSMSSPSLPSPDAAQRLVNDSTHEIKPHHKASSELDTPLALKSTEPRPEFVTQAITHALPEVATPRSIHPPTVLDRLVTFIAKLMKRLEQILLGRLMRPKKEELELDLQELIVNSPRQYEILEEERRKEELRIKKEQAVEKPISILGGARGESR